jgi:hypothetical protein
LRTELDGPVSTEPLGADTAQSIEAHTNEPPGWLMFVAFVAAGGMLSFGAIGLLLAINGWYRPALAFPLGLVVLAGLVFIAWPRFAARGVSTRSTHVYAAIGVAAVLAITAWNGSHASQHVEINRDGGAYAVEGRWIARDGSLEVHARTGPFAHDSALAFGSYAVYDLGGGRLQFQFAHLLPALLAEAYSIGGARGLYHLPEVLGGISLLAFFVLSWRLFKQPLFALSAMLALAFIVPQVWYSRDSYSEIPTQILLFTALWLLVSRRGLPHWRIALVAGLFLGAVESTRIDGLALLVGVPVILGISWLRARDSEHRKATLQSIGAFVGGLIPGLTLGLVDLGRHSGTYGRFFGDLSSDLHRLVLAVVAATVGMIIVVALWRYIAPVLRRVPWNGLATASSILVVVVGFGAWILRPRIQTLRGNPIGLIAGLQGAEHVAVDPTRRYWEYSLTWMSWYLGPLTLAAAIVGAALLVRELLLGRRMYVLAALMLLGPEAVLYLYKAKVVSDHVWADRRFLVGAFPALILLALGLAAALWEHRWRPNLVPYVRGGAVLFAVAAVAYPIYTVLPVRAMSEQRAFLTLVNSVCDQVGDHGAILILERDYQDLYDDWLPQTFRSWCGVPVAARRGKVDTAEVKRLADQWAAEGRTLFVASKDSGVIDRLLPGSHVLTTPVVTNPWQLEATVTRRPSHYREQRLLIALAEVPRS